MTTAEAEDCWCTIVRLLERTSDPEVLAALAAGPLELLIEDSGSRFIDQIEKEAWRNPAFCQLLTFVWDCTPTEMWTRVDAIRTVAAGGRMTRGASMHWG
jgi:hypothetical protein